MLWATETVYLRAWGYAKSFIPPIPTFDNNPSFADDLAKDNHRKSKPLSSGAMSELEGSVVSMTLSTSPKPPSSPKPPTPPNYSSDLDTGALRSAFIPNWTSRAFESFVAEIAELTDLLAEREDAVGRKLDVYKAVWGHVLDVERRFWPDVGVCD